MTKPDNSSIRLHRNPAKNYSSIPNALWEIPNLSWRAKGIFAYLFSKREDWTARVFDIQKHGTEGRDAVRAALHELRALGYAKLERKRDKATGALKGWEWIISFTGSFPKASIIKKRRPRKKSPTPEKPTSVYPTSESQSHNKTDSNKTDLSFNSIEQKSNSYVLYDSTKGEYVW